MKRFNINDAIYQTKGSNDECYTPRYVVEAIIPFIPKHVKTVWCPFDKPHSFFVQVLQEHGYNVLHSHIDDGKYYYTYEPQTDYDIIISNPPFTNKKEIFTRALELDKPFMLLMTAQWLNDSAPVDLHFRYGWNMQLIHFRKRVRYLNCENKVPFKSIFFCNKIPNIQGNTFIDR